MARRPLRRGHASGAVQPSITCAHQSLRARSRTHGAARALRARRTDLAGLGLLVDAASARDSAPRRAPARDRQAGALRSARVTRCANAASIRPRRCDRSRRHHHAAADRLAVQPLAVAQAGLDRVAEGVAEIEDRAQARLRARPGATTAALISHERLTACASAGRSRAMQRVDVRLDPVEERGVGDRPVLDHFGQPGAEFALRQACRACRDRRPRAAAGRTRRSCSCRADG